MITSSIWNVQKTATRITYSMEERNGEISLMLEWWMHSCETKPFWICRPEARAQKNLKKMIFRFRITDENSPDISAHYEPALTIVSSAYTPDKPCKPRTEARVSIFSREPPLVLLRNTNLLRRPWILTLILASTPWMGTSLSTLSRRSDSTYSGETYFAFISLDI